MRVVLAVVWCSACGPAAQKAIVPEADPAPAPVAPVARRPESLDGAWTLAPSERRLRELKIIAAVSSGDAQERERLGDLTPQEQAVVDAWVGRRGEDVTEKRAEWLALRTERLTFRGSEVTVARRGEEALPPVPYEVVADSGVSVTVSFDAGDGAQTHAFAFTSDVSGTDAITLDEGRTLEPVAIARAD